MTQDEADKLQAGNPVRCGSLKGLVFGASLAAVQLIWDDRPHIIDVVQRRSPLLRNVVVECSK